MQLAGGLGGVSLYRLAVNAATCTIPISVAYAVIKHRLFDIKFVVRRGLQYLLAKRLLQILLAMPIAALVYTVFTSRNRTIAELVTGNTTYLYSIAAFGLSLQSQNPRLLAGSTLLPRAVRFRADSGHARGRAGPSRVVRCGLASGDGMARARAASETAVPVVSRTRSTWPSAPNF